MRAHIATSEKRDGGARPHAIFIGCAGWTVPTTHRQRFNEQGSALERYSSRLNAVEINSSFYRPHQPKTYERWALSVPAEFRFSVKVPKTITHEHALVGTASLVDRFLDECLHLGRKLGGLLVQIPPSLIFDARQANAFFGLLRRRLPDGVAVACEPRHLSWFGPNAELIWDRHHINRISADPPIDGRNPEVLPSPTGAWRYWRLHGSPRMYYSSYSPAFLQHLLPMLLRSANASNVWVIFDNTANGHAVADALMLKSLLQAAGVSTIGSQTDA